MKTTVEIISDKYANVFDSTKEAYDYVIDFAENIDEIHVHGEGVYSPEKFLEIESHRIAYIRNGT